MPEEVFIHVVSFTFGLFLGSPIPVELILYRPQVPVQPRLVKVVKEPHKGNEPPGLAQHFGNHLQASCGATA